jgi:FAD/FMN-containing dehydrogenase/Fe-S oxidoreductase
MLLAFVHLPLAPREFLPFLLMDQERERIQADLRGLLAGEVYCDDAHVQLYASDASIYEMRPLGLVRPRHAKDVIRCVEYAAENNLPLHARGAGSGLAGESLGPGLIVDFAHSMDRILDMQGDTVRVQPGVVLGELNRYLAQHGRQFGPDPATASVTTMGSVLNLDVAGSHWLAYGSAHRHVVSMQVVLADGTMIEAGSHNVPERFVDPTEGADPALRSAVRRDALVRRLADLLRREEKLIAEHQPQSLVNRSGYRLHGVLEGNQLNLAKVLVGSEGTLALTTEAVVRTVPRPKHRGAAMLFFERLESAVRAALQIRQLGVSACDLLDRRILAIARETDPRYAVSLPREAEAMLLVEQQGEQQNEVRDRLQKVVERARRRKLAFDARMTLETDELAFYQRLTERVIPTLYRIKGSTRPLPFIEDIAAPPESLPDFLVRLQNVLKTHQVTASLFGHVGHGQLHIRPFLDLTNPDDVRKMQDLAADLYHHVMEVKGTISGEHGDGLSRTWFLRQQYGPLYDVFREVKRIFDPQNILNPGKVAAEVAQPLTKNLRPLELPVLPSANGHPPGVASVPATGPIPLQLNWGPQQVLGAARACNGCGRCRTLAPEERMCPIFRLAPSEEASPRAKANLMRAVMTGRLDPKLLATDTVKGFADLCVHCHQCRLECPANVDVPKLMVECKGQYVATNGLNSTDWCLTRLDKLSSLGSQFSTAANWAIANRRMRWVLEKLLGVAQGRKLPRFVARSFLRKAQRLRLTRPTRDAGAKVLYFVDVYANWHDTQLAEALVAVLQHNGVSVYVPPEQVQSGMASVAVGDVDRAAVIAAKNVSLLAEAVRNGYHIVTTEPSAALALTREYPNLLDDEDARLVAQNTSEACSYLFRLHQIGQLELDLRPINASLGYHLPCHLRALEVGSPGEQLLRLIPGLLVRRIEKGCSGMAGLYGLKRENYRNSLRIGWGLITALRDPVIQAGATECSACKIQMEQGVTKPTIHPIKMLALSYGLMPELESLLSNRSEELLVT